MTRCFGGRPHTAAHTHRSSRPAARRSNAMPIRPDAPCTSTRTRPLTRTPADHAWKGGKPRWKSVEWPCPHSSVPPSGRGGDACLTLARVSAFRARPPRLFDERKACAAASATRRLPLGLGEPGAGIRSCRMAVRRSRGRSTGFAAVGEILTSFRRSGTQAALEELPTALSSNHPQPLWMKARLARRHLRVKRHRTQPGGHRSADRRRTYGPSRRACADRARSRDPAALLATE